MNRRGGFSTRRLVKSPARRPVVFGEQQARSVREKERGGGVGGLSG